MLDRQQDIISRGDTVGVPRCEGQGLRGQELPLAVDLQPPSSCVFFSPLFGSERVVPSTVLLCQENSSAGQRNQSITWVEWRWAVDVKGQQ